MFNLTSTNQNGADFSNNGSAKRPWEEENEGEYIAALRGSNSFIWQASQQERTRGGQGGHQVFPPLKRANNGIMPPSACYKCQQEGHWAKDCPAGTGTHQGYGEASYMHYQCNEERGGKEAPDRPCPCGAGICLVLTAKTVKNNGRQFYRCPKDEGKCSFSNGVMRLKLPRATLGEMPTGGAPWLVHRELQSPSSCVRAEREIARFLPQRWRRMREDASTSVLCSKGRAVASSSGVMKPMEAATEVPLRLQARLATGAGSKGRSQGEGAAQENVTSVVKKVTGAPAVL